MTVFSFSETYSMIEVRDIMVYVKECLLKLGASKILATGHGGEVVLNASRVDLTIRVILSEDRMGAEAPLYSRGQPVVRIEATMTSEDDKELQESVEQFRRCLFIRAVRPGG